MHFRLSEGYTYLTASKFKSSLTVILMGQPTFYDQWFTKYGFWAVLRILGPNLVQKWVSPTFRPDNQVNLKNRPSKDSKTAAVLEFAKIGQSSPSSTGLLLFKMGKMIWVWRMVSEMVKIWGRTKFYLSYKYIYIFFIIYLAAPRPTLGQWQKGSLFNQYANLTNMLIAHLLHTIFFNKTLLVTLKNIHT